MAKPLQISRTNAIFSRAHEFSHSLGRLKNVRSCYSKLAKFYLGKFLAD